MLGLTNALVSSSTSHRQQYSLLLDGVGDCINMGDNLDFGTGAFSISLWFKIDDLDARNYQYMFSKRQSTNDRIGILINDSNKIQVVGNVSGTETFGLTGSSALGDDMQGQWIHVVAVTNRAGNEYIYVNGSTDHHGASAASSNDSANFDNTGDILIGKSTTDSSSYAFGGEIDDVAIFNVALDAAAVSAMYNDGRPFDLNNDRGNYDNSSALQGYWKMFDGSFDDKANGVVHDAHNPGYGAELITDGTFNGTLTDNWTVESDCAVVVFIEDPWWGGRALKIKDVGGSHNRVSQDIDLDTYVGKTLKLEYNVLDSSGLGADAFKSYFAGAYVSIPQTNGHHVVYWTQSSAGNTNFYLNLYNQDNDDYIIIDNVSVKVLNGYPGITAADATHSTDTPDDQTMSNVLTLDGVNDYLSTEADSTAAARTYSFWARSSYTSSNMGVFGHGDAHIGAFHFNASDGGSNTSNPLLYTNTGGQHIYWPNVAAQDDGNWHHWAVYINPGTGGSQLANSKLWVDGVAQTPVSTPGSGTAASYTSGLTIGSDSDSHFFDGDIDQFAVFDTELPTDAVASLAGEMWEGGDTDIANWTAQGTNDQEVDDGALHVTAGDDGSAAWDDGSRINLYKTADGGYLNSDLIMGRTYKFTCEVKVGSGDTAKINLGEVISTGAITSTTYTTVTLYYTPMSGKAPGYYAYYPWLRFNDMNDGGEVWIKSISLIDTEARKNDLTKTIGNYDSDWTDNLINYWKMGDGASDEVGDGIVHDQTDSGYGAELITTPDLRGYTSTPTGWVVNNEDAPTEQITWSSNGARFYAEDSSQILHMQDDFSVTSGKTYKIEVVISNYNGSAGIKIDNTPSGGAYEMTSNGTHVFYIKAVANGVMADIYRTGSNVDLVIERFSMKELNGDPGMTTSGATIIKQPV